MEQAASDIWENIERDTSGTPQPLVFDSEGVWIYCSRAVWREHILKYHPEIEPVRDLIIAALISPERREVDEEDTRITRVYVAVLADRVPFTHAMWLRVIVKYVTPAERDYQRTGLLTSAYFVRKRETAA